MKTRTLVNGVVAGLGILLMLLPSADAYAWGRSRPHEDVSVGYNRYHYRDGRFYQPSWFGFSIVIGTPPFGAIVTGLPSGCRTVLVNGAPYYYYGGIYYRRHASGYVVVPTPVVQNTVVSVGPAQTAAYETVTINIPNYNGSFTPVTLVKRSNGFVGPQGEFYPDRPTVEQLRVLYGS